MNKLCVLTASFYYVVAKVNGFILLDMDLLPLQGEHWQTDQMLSAYFSLLANRFLTPNSLRLHLDFTSVGKKILGSGVATHLNNKTPLPLSSVCITYVCIILRGQD